MKLRLLLAIASLVPSFCCAQNVVQNPTASQTINQPSGTNLFVNSLENVKFADRFSSVQAAINALPSTGGTVYIPPGTYTGPTTIPSNVSLISLASVGSQDVYGSFGLQNIPGVHTQVSLTYSSDLALTNVANIRLSGITLDFQAAGHGMVLTSSSFNTFDHLTLKQAGSTTEPALRILSSGTGAQFNSIDNVFTDLSILCNQSSGQYATGILLEGSGTVSNGSAVTQNRFNRIVITGNVLVGVDFELNANVNYFDGVQVNQDEPTAPTGSAALAFNTITPGSDEAADGDVIQGLNITGPFSEYLKFGQSTGNVITLSAGGAVTIQVLGGTPSYTIQTVALPGLTSQFISPTAVLTGPTPASGVSAGQVAFGATTAGSATTLVGYLVVNISGTQYKLPVYH